MKFVWCFFSNFNFSGCEPEWGRGFPRDQKPSLLRWPVGSPPEKYLVKKVFQCIIICAKQRFFNVLICVIRICFDLKPTLDDEMADELEDGVQQGYFTKLVRLEKKRNDYFHETHKVVVCSHKYFILNNFSNISLDSTFMCFQIYSSWQFLKHFTSKFLCV